MKLIRTTDPVTLAVSDADQKLHAKIDGSADDALVAEINKAAIEVVEDRLERGFLTQTWELSLDGFPESGCPIDLCRSPATIITSIKYINTDGVLTTLAATEYTLDDKSEPPQVVEDYLKTWPSTRNVVNSVTILFVVEEGATAAAIPEKYIMIIKQLFVHWYEHREPLKDKNWAEIPQHMEMLMKKYESKVLG